MSITPVVPRVYPPYLVLQPPPALADLFARTDAERKLGPFHLERQLGRGGFAPVWLASEVYEGIALRPVAVKIFAVDDAGGTRGRYREHVVREARALCQVEHPNIVRFYSLHIEEKNGLLGLAMEYLSGDSLADRVRDRGRLPIAEVVDVGIAVASALAAAHATGIVHRDVKPANVMLTGQGRYKLIDFGISTADEVEAERAPRPKIKRVLVGDLPLEILGTKLSMLVDAHTLFGEDSTATGGVVASGTLGYIDPFCVSSGAAATPSSDLYSLGALLYECVTGKLPAVAATDRPGLRSEVLDGREAPPASSAIVDDVPRSLASLIARLVEPGREQRPTSADEVVRALEAVRAETSAAAPPVAATTPQRLRLPLLVSGVAAAGLIAIMLTARDRPDTIASVTNLPPPSAIAPPALLPEVRPTATSMTEPAPVVVAARVEVRPPDAKVLVGGKLAERDAEGRVLLSGEPGTSVELTLDVAGKVSTQRVVLLRDGRTEPRVVKVAATAAARPAGPVVAAKALQPDVPTPATAAPAKPVVLKPKDDF